MYIFGGTDTVNTYVKPLAELWVLTLYEGLTFEWARIPQESGALWPVPNFTSLTQRIL